MVWSEQLKTALADAINAILQPVRDHFANNKEAADLLIEVKVQDQFSVFVLLAIFCSQTPFYLSRGCHCKPEYDF